MYVSDGLTIDFDETTEPFPVLHLCFRVDDAELDAILGRIRAARVEYRNTPHGPVDGRVNAHHGGRIVYWNDADGHHWEMLTVSHARQRK